MTTLEGCTSSCVSRSSRVTPSATRRGLPFRVTVTSVIGEPPPAGSRSARGAGGRLGRIDGVVDRANHREGVRTSLNDGGGVVVVDPANRDKRPIDDPGNP